MSSNYGHTCYKSSSPFLSFDAIVSDGSGATIYAAAYDGAIYIGNVENSILTKSLSPAPATITSSSPILSSGVASSSSGSSLTSGEIVAVVLCNYGYRCVQYLLCQDSPT